MKLKHTEQEISVSGNEVTIGESVFRYDYIRTFTDRDHKYIECSLGGKVEDRFLVV